MPESEHPAPLPGEVPLPPIGHVFRDANGHVFRVASVRQAFNGDLVYPRNGRARRVVVSAWFPGGLSDREHAIVEPYTLKPGDTPAELKPES